MPGTNRRIFISHSHDDNQRCEPLLAAMDAWGLDYWFDTQELNPGQQLSDRLQQALAERDIFIRVCTIACQQSFWTTQELLAFRGLQQDQRHNHQRQMIFLILDAGYQLEPIVEGDAVINAATRPQSEWMRDLRQRLQVTQVARTINRRAFLALGASAIATVASAGTAAAVLIRAHSQPGTQSRLLVPTTHQSTPTPLANSQRIRWYRKFSIPASSESVPAMTLSNHTIYLSTALGNYALSEKDGSTIWSKTNNATQYNSLVPAGDKLYGIGLDASAFSTAITCLSPTDGSTIWSTPFSPLNASGPALSSDAAFASGNDGYVYAFNLAGGAQKWKAKIGGSSSGQSAPAYAGGRLFVGSDDGALHSLDAATGTPIWKYPTRATEVQSSPLVLGGVVYFGARDGGIYALNAADGSLKWRYSFNNYAYFDVSPVVDNGTLYIAEVGNGTLVALDVETGALQWKQQYPLTPGSRITLAPAADRVALSQSVIYAALSNVTRNFLVAADRKTGKELWRVELPQGSGDGMTSPVLDGATVYLASGDAGLYAIDATGA
jgi:outer membrane protein assembly factor BamB